MTSRDLFTLSIAICQFHLDNRVCLKRKLFENSSADLLLWGCCQGLATVPALYLQSLPRLSQPFPKWELFQCSRIPIWIISATAQADWLRCHLSFLWQCGCLVPLKIELESPSRGPGLPTDLLRPCIPALVDRCMGAARRSRRATWSGYLQLLLQCWVADDCLLYTTTRHELQLRTNYKPYTACGSEVEQRCSTCSSRLSRQISLARNYIHFYITFFSWFFLVLFVFVSAFVGIVKN